MNPLSSCHQIVKIALRPLSLSGALLCMALIIPTANATAGIVLSEDFEGPKWTVGDRLTGTLNNGWKGNDDGTTATLKARIDSAPSGSPENVGSQSLFLSDNSATGTPNATYDLGSTVKQGYIEFSIKSVSGTGFYLKLFDAGSSTVNFQLAISSNSTISLLGTGDPIPSVSYSDAGYIAGEWNTVRINFDKTTNSVTILFNGVIANGLTVTSGDFDSVNWQAGKLQLVAGYNGGTNVSAYFDNITVYNAVPEPSSLVLLFGAGILGLGWTRARLRSC